MQLPLCVFHSVSGVLFNLVKAHCLIEPEKKSLAKNVQINWFSKFNKKKLPTAKISSKKRKQHGKTWAKTQSKRSTFSLKLVQSVCIYMTDRSCLSISSLLDFFAAQLVNNPAFFFLSWIWYALINSCNIQIRSIEYVRGDFKSALYVSMEKQIIHAMVLSYINWNRNCV